MRVLFLDIDGVLNSRSFVERSGWAPPLGSERDRAIIDPAAVALVNQVVEATGAVIVLSSSWRAAYELTALQAMLTACGLTGQVVGVTPQLTGRARAREIAHWLADHAEVETFAIVDDDESAGELHRSRFVLTTYERGIQRDHVFELVRVLSTRA